MGIIDKVTADALVRGLERVGALLIVAAMTAVLLVYLLDVAPEVHGIRAAVDRIAAAAEAACRPAPSFLPPR